MKTNRILYYSVDVKECEITKRPPARPTFQANSWSLEDLKLDVYIGDGGGSEPVSMDDFSFGIEGLKVRQ